VVVSETEHADRMKTYFDFLDYYFDINSDTKQPLSVEGDPFRCLRHQKLEGWRKPQFSPSPMIELVGVEGSGHHAIHALIGNSNETGHAYLKFRGASWHMGSAWRNDKPGPDGKSGAFEANIRARPMHDLDATLFRENPADLYIVLVRSPGASAVSALRRFGGISPHSPILRQLQVQRDTQFENMLLLSNYIRALPCGRTLFMPLELLTSEPKVSTAALVEASGSLLKNPSLLLDFARSGEVSTSKMHAGVRANQTTEAHHEGSALFLDLLRLNAGTNLEKDFLRYRALWPALAPSHRFLNGTGSLDVGLKIKPTPPYWPALYD
jgi:hypothetical protein